MTSALKPHVTTLPDRGVVSVTGLDAEKLLGGLITNDMARLIESPALYAGLLTPQGKILFDFFVVRSAEGFLVEVARSKAPELVKRLTLYKLRASVEIRDVSDEYAVMALWALSPVSSRETVGAVAYPDPRYAPLGLRILAKGLSVEQVAEGLDADLVRAQSYDAYRVELGVPEGGKDFAYGDAFPHEALMDQLNGISFTKGCFVGQEVVSRMQHRTTVRKRVVCVGAEMSLPLPPMPVLVGEAEIGKLGSVDGSRGLALVRIDRVAEAQRLQVPVTAGGVPIAVEVPPFATFEIGAAENAS